MTTQAQAYAPDDATQHLRLELLKDKCGLFGVGLVGNNVSENDRTMRIVELLDVILHVVSGDALPASSRAC